MRVFISHISEEAALATVLKDWIESSFVGQCNVFVSSDRDDIPAGSKWVEEIDKALEEAVTLLVLCSPTSLSRPWINFETGCGWIKRVPIVPICHSGQKKGTLPAPLSLFQALELEDQDFTEHLLSGLAKYLGFSKIPRIDQAAMKKELVEALARVESVETPDPKEGTATAEADISQEGLEILKLLGKNSDVRPTSKQLAAHFKMSEQRMQYFLDLLDDQKLIHRAIYFGSPSTYSLRSEGRKFLFARGLL